MTRLAQRLIQCLDRSANPRDIARPGSGQHSIHEVACGSQQPPVEISVGAHPREIIGGPHGGFKAIVHNLRLTVKAAPAQRRERDL